MNPHNNGRALLGFHDNDFRVLAESYFRGRGYEVTAVQTPGQMIQYLMSNDAYWVMMNLNLDSPGSEDPGNAGRIYDMISHREKNGLLKFLGVSMVKEAVEEAERRGIPAMLTGDFAVRKNEIVEEVE